MSQMFLTNDEHFNFLNQCVKASPTKVTIASFGIYIGITYQGADTTKWGKRYQLATRDFLDSVQQLGNGVRLLIGVGDYQSCRGTQRCLACEQKYAKQLMRLVNQAELFQTLEWRLTSELHMKCVLFDYDGASVRGVAGGRNFTDSTWADVTFELSHDQIKKLSSHVDKLWATAKPITDSVIEDLLRLYKIPSDTLQSLVAECEG